MPNYITGYGKSAVKVYDYIGYLRTYTLPMCNISGLDEDNEIRQNINELESGLIVQTFFGIRKKFRLDYSEYITAEQILNIFQPLIDDYINGYRLVFYPKLMNLNYNYEVLISNANQLMKMISNKPATAGMRGLVLELTAKNYVRTPGWLSADNLNSGYFGISTLIE